MAVTILEALQNADYNIRNNGAMGLMLAKDQLHNAVELLLKDYFLYDKIEKLDDKYYELEGMNRRDAIETIDDLFPADSPDESIAAEGKELLEQARINMASWRNEPDEVLFDYARLCIEQA